MVYPDLQLMDGSTIFSSIHKTIWRLGLPFINRVIYHGHYDNHSDKYSIKLEQNVSNSVMTCTMHPYILVWGPNRPNIIVDQLYMVNLLSPFWYSDCLSNANVTSKNVSFVMVLKRRANVLLPVNT